MAKTSKVTPDAVLALWIERDLGAEVSALPRAYEIDGTVEHVESILAGGQNVLLLGEPGVGKTALVYELVRRMEERGSLADLGLARVLQISAGLRFSRLKDHKEISKATASLLDALDSLGVAVLLFFRDGDAFAQFGLGQQLESYCMRSRTPMIVEGHPAVIRAMLEDYEDLEQHFVTVPVAEPDVDRTHRILAQWSRESSTNPGASGGAQLGDGALEEALYLTHRFLSRGRLPRKALDLLRSSAAGETGTVGAEKVIDRFCAVHHTPRWLVDPKVPLDLASLEDRLADALLGQDRAVAAALSVIALIKAGLSDMQRPFAVFLFVGPTGVGKTHLAQMLARELFGAADRMVRINLGDFTNEMGARALFGDPESYQLSNRRGVLTQRLMARPFGVLLIDELEKAHESVHDRLLPLMDEGEFTNGAGELVSCRSSIIIATSNAGAEVYRESALGFTTPVDEESKRRELDRRVQRVFRFELLNRFDRIVHFDPLGRDDIRALALREIQNLEQRPGLRRARMGLRVDEAVLDWLVVHGYDAEFGARFLKRTIEREVTTAVADVLARGAAPAGTTLELDVRRNRIRARLEEVRPVVTSPGRATSGRRGNDTSNVPMKPRAILERASSRLAALEAQRAERTAMLAAMAEPGFWDREDERNDILERFRALDVAVQIAQRFAAPLSRLEVVLGDEETKRHPVPATIIGDAADALSRWEARDLLDGGHAAWLILSQIEPTLAPHGWMTELARMEMAWCRRLELRCTPAAFERRSGDTLGRLVLEVEGPGAEHYLGAEPGVHRQRRQGQPDARVRLDVIARAGAQSDVRVRDCAATPGPMGMTGKIRASFDLPQVGQSIVLLGPSRATLESIAGDLRAAWLEHRSESPELARSYGEPGGVAVDPRTGTSAPMRSVLRGRLEPFYPARNTSGNGQTGDGDSS